MSIFRKKIQESDRHMQEAVEQLGKEIRDHAAAVADLRRRFAALDDVADAGDRYVLRTELESERDALEELGGRLAERSAANMAFWEERVRFEDEQLEAYPPGTEPSPN